MKRAEGQISKINERLVYFSAFALPVAMFLLLCAVKNAIPFGDAGFLERDMLSQYIKYFSYLQSIASGENDVFYTYSKALGGDMTGLWAYYLLSPLNIIFLFAPKAVFPLATTFVIAAKLGLCGLTMALLLSKLHRPCLGVLAFSTAYAFMSYNIAYFNNIMWLDGVYMLPLIILGLERILAGGSALMYSLTLFLALVFNYYIGYMICIFLVLFFALRICGDVGIKKAGSGKIFLRFTYASLLAGAMAAFLLLPTALSLSGTKASLDAGRLSMYPMYTLSQQLSKLVCAAVPTGYTPGDLIMSDLPNIYCGAAISALALMNFSNRNIKPRTRVSAAIFLLVLFLSFNYNGSYVIWHAFNYPALFPYRNAFLLSFVMIWLAWQNYMHRDGIDIKAVIITFCLVALVVLIIDPFRNLLVSRKMMLLDLGAILLCVVLVLKAKNVRLERVCALLLIVVQIFLLLVNAEAHIGGKISASAYKSNAIEKQQKIDQIKNYDPGFYRTALTYPEHNSGMQFSYNGFDHFSSTEKSTSKEFAIKFGLRHFLDVWVNYTSGSTSSADAFLGIKYFVGERPEQKQSSLIVLDERAGLYQNTNALDIAFLADAQLLNKETEKDDIFLWQEQVFSSVLGHDAGIFIKEEALAHEVVNMQQQPFDVRATKYEKSDPEKECSINYSFTVTENLPLYMYTSMPYVEAEVGAQLYVNGVNKGAYMGSFDWQAVYLGTFAVGDQIEVEIRPNAHYFLQNATYFAYEDQQALAQACEQIRLRSENAQLEKVRNSYLRWTGSVTEETPVLLFTVPHDKGWRAEVDGEPAEIRTALDTLVSLELTPGEHTVELRFTPPGLYAGLGISLCAMLIFIVLIIKKKI